MTSQRIPRILKPRDGTAESLQQEINHHYYKYQAQVQTIDEEYKNRINKLFTPLADGDAAGVNIDTFIDVVRDYATSFNEATAQYYADNREMWAFASDIELPDYDTVYASAERAIYDRLRGYSNTDYNGLTWTQVRDGKNRAGITTTSMWARALEGLDSTDPLAWFNLANDIAHRAGRLTTLLTAQKDPSGVRYARVPQGVTCEWCVMIASRGFVYHTEDSAGELKRYHPNDDCLIIPSWGKQSVPDYNPDRLYEQYAKCRDAVEQYASRDQYHRWVLEQPKDTTIPRYDVWKRNQILAEMRTRDREWLNNGTPPTIQYESDRAERELARHERTTIQSLTQVGIKVEVKTRSLEDGVKTPDLVINNALADMKTPRGSSKNTVDQLMRSARHQGATICIIDLQRGMSNLSVEDCINQIEMNIKRRKLQEVMLLDYDNRLIRIKPRR
ncbi:hypothetical protein ACHEUQ_03085 [Alloscardovia omnicolens]|jgi:hypothetical protein|uniref:VG15 protein n=1 Tax=Alloscardovia omnicolens TaxID=419015 RepID=UPI000665742A|nr:hypothetical protein [Alloscardovia omnicolens]